MAMLKTMSNSDLMRLALDAAKQSGDDVPIGAVILGAAGNVLASAANNRAQTSDPTGHAEIVAIRKASEQLGDWRLTDCTLIVTLEPCVMCAGAIQAARIPKVVFGAFDQAVGAAGSRYDLLRDEKLGQQVEVIGGVLKEECAELIERFFQDRRS
jgi:tRNA(adenine34) deaminase